MSKERLEAEIGVKEARIEKLKVEIEILEKRLKEIKNEPETYIQIHVRLNKIFKSDTFMSIEHIKALIEAGEENNELRHFEQKTVFEWWEDYGNGSPGPSCATYDGNWVRTAIFNCWKACKKSHNLNS